jgi:glycerol-3-phosphate O-acyltransferase
MARPVKEAENRLAGFNRERDSILRDVEERVRQGLVAEARRGGDASLEYVLNDVAYQEIRRLERGAASTGERKRAGEWRDLARRLGTMTDDEKRAHLDRLVHEMAKDVCGNFDERVYRLATGMLPPVISGLLAPGKIAQGLRSLGDLSDRVVIDGPLEQVRACADRGTLIVVPTHASNMDSVVFGWSLHRAGLPPCTYGAGKNLFSNPFISFFMHNLGAYRVDRRITHGLYKAVLKTYSQVLLERGYHSLFFPGGTRSRSGAVERKPKLGLLSTAIAAYVAHLRRGETHRRLFIVPATINYAVVLEAETLIDDYLAEEGKHRYIIEDDEFSRLGRLFDFSRRILAMEGALHIRYGTPLDPVGNPVDADGNSLDPRGRQIDPASYFAGPDGALSADPQRDAEYTRGLGDELVRHYRRLTVFLPTHLVCRSVYDRLAKRHGTRDVYRLLRFSEHDVAESEIREDLVRYRDALAGHPEVGALAERYATTRPADLIEEALRMLRGYHTRPVLELVGERLVARDLRLLFYYQNRTAHVDPAVLA